MNISSIQVIKSNRGGGIAVAPVSALPGEKVELTYGDILRVNVTSEYRGPATEVTLYGAIGVRGLIEFGEEVTGTAPPFPLDKTADWTPTTLSVDIPITEDIDPGTDYDLYCKLLEYPEAGMPEINDAIDIVGVPPTYELIQHTISHFAYIYNGDAEVNIATFKIAPFAPSGWVAKIFSDALESEARKKGINVLEVKVYVDTTPLLWTDIRIEVTGTPLGEGVAAAPGMAVGIAPWIAIILVCLAIIAVIIVATLALEQWMETFTKKPGLDDLKPTWKKEALILDIQDTEGYLEQTVTPTETLEEMSEEELRHNLNELAKKVVPPVPDLWPLLLLGGLGVLGLGGIAAAYAMTKPAGE